MSERGRGLRGQGEEEKEILQEDGGGMSRKEEQVKKANESEMERLERFLTHHFIFHHRAHFLGELQLAKSLL